MDRYMGFLALDETIHDATRFLLSDRGDGDFGQYRRVAGVVGERGKMPDNKDIFHFGSKTRQVVESRVAGALPPEAEDFLDAAESIYWRAQRAKRLALTSLLGPKDPMIELMNPEQGTLADVLRFIAYYRNGKKLAQRHFDRDLGTLALGESSKGLRIAPGKNDAVTNVTEEYLAELEARLQPAEYIEGHAKFFLGAGWYNMPEKYLSGVNHLPIGLHEVEPAEERVSEQIMRWSAVFFINPPLEIEGYRVPSEIETRPYKKFAAYTA